VAQERARATPTVADTLWDCRYCATYDVPQNIQVWDVSSPDPRHWKVLSFLISHQSDVTDLCWFQQVSAWPGVDYLLCVRASLPAFRG